MATMFVLKRLEKLGWFDSPYIVNNLIGALVIMGTVLIEGITYFILGSILVSSIMSN